MVKRISESLSAKLLCGVLASLLAAAAVFVLTLVPGILMLDHTVYGEPFAHKMADVQFSVLQDYVNDESITEKNVKKIGIWCGKVKKVYLSLYDDGKHIYSSSNMYLPAENNDWETVYASDITIDDEDPGSMYTLTLADGKTVQAFLYYYPGDAFYLGILILSSLTAFLAFSFCFITLVHRKLAYVKKLKQELDILSGGALEYPVTVSGKDELGQLAFGIDQMRRSILSHQKTEEMTRAANCELVTAMSHDLRTPLTSLMAYLELIDRGKYENEDQLHTFVKKSIDKALRIKTMADQMFEYFLVYSSEWEEQELEHMDADMMFRQIMEDYAFALENNGFSVNRDFQKLDGDVRVNAELLHRVFDNIYSNLLKYADKEYPVNMSFKQSNGTACVCISNHISPQRSRRESTNIGLNTCRSIMQYHGGTFENSEKDDIFSIEMSMPLAAS